MAAAAIVVSAAIASQPAVSIPEFWSEELLHDYELPLATPENSPKHVSRDYYYALPERVLYKSYPIYHPSTEPAGYLDKLRALDPEPAFDAATLKTDGDWIAAGRDVFEMPIDYNGPIVTMTDGARSRLVRAASRAADHRRHHAVCALRGPRRRAASTSATSRARCATRA